MHLIFIADGLKKKKKGTLGSLYSYENNRAPENFFGRSIRGYGVGVGELKRK